MVTNTEKQKDLEALSYEEILNLAKDELVFLPEPVREIIKSAFVFYFVAL